MSEDTPVSVTMEKDGEVAVIIVNNPPVNALSWHVRQGLEDNFGAAQHDRLDAVVGKCGLEIVFKALADVPGQRVHRGIVDDDDGDFAVLLHRHADGGFIGHGRLLGSINHRLRRGQAS